MDWDEYFKGNYKEMTKDERLATVDRLEKMYTERTGKNVNISEKGEVENTLFGYAFNVSKCLSTFVLVVPKLLEFI